MTETQHPRMTDLLRTRVASWILLVTFAVDAFVLSPLVGMGVVPVWLGALATSATFVAAAVALHGRHGANALVVGVVGLAIVAHFGRIFVGPDRTEFLRAAVTVLACGTFALLFLLDVFSFRRLPSRLLSVLFAYLFMGAAWAGAYHVAAILQPGSIALPGTHHPGSEFLYFSFATLSTVGYGDVVPVGPLVRSLAVLEALAGQLYLVLVVSRFVGERASTSG